MNYGLIWLILLIVFLVVEVLTDWLVFLCIAAGCLAGLVASWFDLGFAGQLICVGVFTIVASCLIIPRVHRKRMREKQAAEHASGMGALIGRTLPVTEQINGTRAGRVRADGDSWQAICPNGDTVARGKSVVVTNYDSIILHVKPID
jgi:membrane protein implicated in regulation of membrane protease activity